MRKVETEAITDLRVGKIELYGNRVNDFVELVYIFALPPHILKALYGFKETDVFTARNFAEQSIASMQFPDGQSTTGLQQTASWKLQNGTLTILGLVERVPEKGTHSYQITPKVAAVKQLANTIPGIEGTTAILGSFPRNNAAQMNTNLATFLGFLSMGKNLRSPEMWNIFQKQHAQALSQLARNGILEDVSGRHFGFRRRGINYYVRTQQGKALQQVLSLLAEKIGEGNYNPSPSY